MNIKIQQINKSWKLFTLENDQGMSVSILNFGGIITQIIVPDQFGKMENVVLGYKDFDDYMVDPNYFGAIIGRVAGRIQNSNFILEDKKYILDSNEGKHHLHGGKYGFHQVVWDDNIYETNSAVSVELTHISLEDEGKYPGNVKVSVTYTLNNDNELILDYQATSDKTTALTLTNHSYFNLSGNLKNTIHNHLVTVDSSRFVELDHELIPTGKYVNVDNTPFDFRNGAFLKDGIEAISEQNQLATNGYDHYFIFDHQKHENVVVKESNSGRILVIKTNQPGIVIYTGNKLDHRLKLSEGSSKKYLGVTFETQASPASLHHNGFPSVILNPDERYDKQTIYSFGIRE